MAGGGEQSQLVREIDLPRTRVINQELNFRIHVVISCAGIADQFFLIFS
jgi:hypothetical protein